MCRLVVVCDLLTNIYGWGYTFSDRGLIKVEESNVKGSQGI
jgi:hypothetical protein